MPDDLIRSAIRLGVAKLNINTEVSIRGVDAVRGFLDSKGNENTRLEELMVEARGAMVGVVKKYIEFFGSAGKICVRGVTREAPWPTYHPGDRRGDDELRTMIFDRDFREVSEAYEEYPATSRRPGRPRPGRLVAGCANTLKEAMKL